MLIINVFSQNLKTINFGLLFLLIRKSSFKKKRHLSHKNLEKAMKVLRSRLYDMEMEKKLASDSEKRKSMVSSGDRSAKIRTYNYPQGRVTDHRIGLTLYDLNKIMDGDIQKFIDEIQLHKNTEKLKQSES